MIVIGNEILSGKVRDENVPFLARRLFELGVEVCAVHFLPDEHGVLVAAIRQASTEVDYVFTTGGLGPTHDDVTLKAVAEAMGRSFVYSPALEALLDKLYGMPCGPERSCLATIPEGAELIYPQGCSYPQLVVGNVYLFPGVPEVARRKFDLIAQRFQTSPIVSKQLCLNRPEIEIVNILNRVVKDFPRVKIGSYPKSVEKNETVTLTLDSRHGQDVEDALARLCADLGVD